MRHLKILPFILILSILGVLPAFPYAITFSTGSGDGTSASTSTACSTIVSDGSSYLSGNLATATKVYYSGSSGLKLGASSAAGVIKMNLASSVTPTSIVVSAKLYNSTKAATLKVNGSATQSITADFSDLTFNITSAISYLELESSKYCWIQSISVNTSSGSTPSLTLSPTSVSVAATDVANQSIALTTSNFSSSISSVTTGLYSNAECTSAITSGAWVKDITVNSGKTVVTFNVDDNTGAQRQCWLKITATAGSQNASAILPITQAKYSAPTGTFKLYSGDISEGDYVIYYSGKAMNTTVTSNRLQYAEVTPSDNKIINPDESIIWHIAPISETTYWSIYNDAAGKYAGGTSTKNQATMLSDLTTYASWNITGSSTYQFENIGRSLLTTDSDKKWLRNNGTYGFACYGSGTGGALSLYKLDDGTPNAPTFSPKGGSFLEAQSVTLSAEDGAEIYYTTDGTTTPTSSSTHYTGAIPVSSTTTIKAVAIKNDKSSSVASATYTITTPKSVDEIWDEITSSGPEDAYVYGYVSQTNVGGYENNFYISVDGSTESNQLYAYRMDMNSYSVAVGDKVILNGDLTIYNNVKEFKYTSATDCGKIVGYTAKGALTTVAVSGTPTKTVYANGETFDPAGLIVTATYENGFSGVVTEGITWNDDLTDHKVTVNTTVHVTATVGGETSAAYDVAVTVAAKTLVSIAATTASYTIYTGEVLPQPTIMATFSEGDPEDVSAFAVYDSENVFDTETLGEQTITASYTFGGATETTTYKVTVKDYANDVDHPYTVAEAINIITKAIGTTVSARNIYVRGIVSQKSNPSSNAQTYYISDDGTTTNQLEIYKGKYIGGANFTNANQVLVNDEVVVGGKVKLFNSTPEFDSNSEVQSLARTPNFEIADVASFEVGDADLAVTALTVTKDGEGEVTLVSSNHEEFATITEGKIHAVAAGTATITANLAANGIYKAATTTFNVTVIAAQTKYAITFDGNGADGGTAPEAIANQAEGASVTLPENTWTKTDKLFDGWKVINNTTSAEITVTAGAFTMPASAVTIQAQWADPSSWALLYTSNVDITYVNNGSNDKVSIADTEYPAAKAGTSSKNGQVKVTVPVGTHTLHFHAITWNNAEDIVVTASGVSNMSQSTFTLKADAGATGSSVYTLAGTPYMQYYSFTFDAVESETEILFEKTSGSEKRFIFYGVNQEGGIVPVLQSIAIDGDLTNKTYKAGDALNMAGLTVSATYTLGGTPQTPVDITNDPGLSWTYDPITEGQTSVDLTASFDGKTANKTITGLEVASADPKIYVSSTKAEFGTVVPNATVDPIAITVTLTNVAAVTATLGGTNPTAFSIDKTALTANGDITISVVSTATVGEFKATLTISDDASQADSKTINISLKVEDAETPVATTSKWVAATEITDGMQVLITGVKSDVTYAMSTSSSNGNNRTSVAGTLDEGVFTPGDNTMPFTLVATGAEDTYYIMTSNNQYLYNASTSGNSYLKTKAEQENVSWTITLDGDNNAVITSVENTNRQLMRFNNGGSNALFNCYASGQAAIKLYVPQTTPPTPTKDVIRDNLTNGKWGTICPKQTVENIEGAAFYQISYLEEQNNLPYNMVWDEISGTTLTAGQPYFFIANATEIRGNKTGAVLTEAGAAVNGFQGYIGADVMHLPYRTDYEPNEDNTFVIYNNKVTRINGATDLNSERCYIIINATVPDRTAKPKNAALHRVMMSISGADAPAVTTGINEITNDQMTNKVIINGHLFIIRGEKMFDATGRLVK